MANASPELSIVRGACGHDCSRGSCAAGVCTLVADLLSPHPVAVRDRVYVGLRGSDSFVRCEKNGCMPAPTRLTPAAQEPYPWQMVATESFLFASDYSSFNKGGVSRVPLAGGDIVRLPASPVLERSYGIAIDSTTIYWTTTGAAGQVHWCDLPNCAGGMQSAVASADPRELAVASNGALVWSEALGGRLRRCAGKAGCTAEPLVRNVDVLLGYASNLVIEGATVYWGTSYQPRVVSCPITGCDAPTTLVDAAGTRISEVAVIGGALYWSSMPLSGDVPIETEGTITPCVPPRCGPSEVRTVAMHQHDPVGLAFDDASVFWVTTGAWGKTSGVGSLRKAPR